jgi:hypothetical protein
VNAPPALETFGSGRPAAAGTRLTVDRRWCVAMVVLVVYAVWKQDDGISDWAAAGWLVDYHFGIVRRGLPGACLTGQTGVMQQVVVASRVLRRNNCAGPGVPPPRAPAAHASTAPTTRAGSTPVSLLSSPRKR